MKTSIQGLIAMLALIGAAAFTTGCNTMEGAGKDVERVGEGVQDANCTAADKQAGRC